MVKNLWFSLLGVLDTRKLKTFKIIASIAVVNNIVRSVVTEEEVNSMALTEYKDIKDGISFKKQWANTRIKMA